MTFFDVLILTIDVHDFLQENLMLSSDLAGYGALALVMGGVVFWLMILFGAVLGVCRGIMRLFGSARDLLTPVHVDLELAARAGRSHRRETAE